MRLIKVVDATKVYNGIALYMAENAYLNDTALDVLKMVANWLNEAPTVDAVEVVRCKDCKHYKPQNVVPRHHGTVNYCTRVVTLKMPQEGFCCYGERKDKDA